MKKFGRTRLIAVAVSLALLLLSIPIVSYADALSVPEVDWEDVDAQADYQAWAESNPLDLADEKDDRDDDASFSEAVQDDAIADGEAPDAVIPDEDIWDAGIWDADMRDDGIVEAESPDSRDEDPLVRDDGSVVISATLTFDLLRDAYPEMQLGVKPESWFGEPARAESGDVLTVEVGDIELSGQDVCDVFDLDFLNFSVDYNSRLGFLFEEYDGKADTSADDDAGDSRQEGSLAAPAFAPPLGYSLSEAELKAVAGALDIKFLFYGDVRSGTDATLYPIITLDGNQSVTVDPSRISAVISLPENIPWLSMRTYANEWFDFETVDGNLVLSMKKLPEMGGGQNMTTISVSTVNGVIPNGQEVKLGVKVYYDAAELASIEPSFRVIADSFQWDQPSNATNYSAGLTIDGVEKINDIYLQYSVRNTAYYQSTNGRAFTDTVVIEDTVQVSEYVKLTKENLAATQMVYNVANLTKTLLLEPIDFHDAANTLVKSFKMTYTIKNDKATGTGAAELATLSNLRLELKNMELDKDAVEAQIASGESSFVIDKALHSTGMTVKAYPSVDVDSAHVTGGYQQLTAAAYTLKITYNKSGAVDPSDLDNPINSGGIKKAVQSIAGNTSRAYAYPGETVVFTLEGYGNALKSRKLENFVVVDEFDPADFYPVSLTTGNFTGMTSSAYYDIKLILKDGTEIAMPSNNRPRYGYNTVYNLSTVLADAGGSHSLSDITRIEYHYGTVNAGFKMSTKPTVTMMVAAKDESITEATLTNTARLRYAATIESVTTNYPADAGQADQYVSECTVPFYQDVQNDEKLNKDVVKLRGSNGNGKAVGDLLEYTVDFRNTSREEVQNPFFDDVFVGQKPYLSDTKGVLGSYGQAPFIQIVSVTDVNGNDVKSARNLSIASYHVSAYDGDNDSGHHSGLDPVMAAGTLRIRLNGQLKIGDLVKISYVMEITDDAGEIENSFKAWAYPLSGGGSRIIYLGSGHVKPDTVSKVVPSVTQKTTITNVGTGENSATNGAVKDEMVEVKVTITSNSPENASSFTLNSVLHTLYYGGSNYQDLLQWHSDENPLYATVVRYDKDGNPVDTRSNVPYTPNTGSSWKDTQATAYNTWKGGFLLRNDPDGPMELQPQESVVLTYQLKVTDWPDAAKALNQLLYTASTFQQLKAELSSSYVTNINYSQFDGDPTTKSYHYSGNNGDYGYRQIFFKKDSGIYAGIAPQSTVFEINGPRQTANRANTQIRLYNYSESGELLISKLLVRLPRYETIVNVPAIYNLPHAAADFQVKTLSTDGDQDLVEISLKSGQDIRVPVSGSIYSYIMFATTLSDENRQKAVDTANPTVNSYPYNDKSTPYQVALYSSQTLSATNAYKISAGDNSGGEWGPTQTGNLYVSNTQGATTQRTVYASPGMTVQPMKINGSGGYEPIGSDGVTVGQKIAWQVKVYELNYNYSLATLKNPYLVIKLPVGMSYAGKMSGAQSATEYTVGGQNYVRLSLDDVVRTTPATVTIESTGSTLYGDMQAEIYLVTNEIFYNVYNTYGDNTTYGKRIPTPFTLSEVGITGTVYEDYVLNASAKINVGGLFAFTSSMKVQLNGGATAVSTGTDTVQSPRDGKNMIYTMTLNNGGDTLAYQDLVLINRLPNKDDKYNMNEALKGSNVPVAMQSDPVVKLGGTTLTAGSDYTVSYTSASPDHTFTHGDYGNGSPSTSWAATRETATAFRIALANPMAAGGTLEVSFQAKADPDTIPFKNAVAVDTFGFGFNAKLSNTEMTWVASESLPVKVTFPNLNPGVIKGTLFEDEDFNGILDSGENGYTASTVKLHLINAADVIVDTVDTNPLTGEYRFEIEIPGNYTVRIDDLPSGTALFDTVKTEVQGNKFHHDTLTTDEIAIAFEQTVIANAALVPDIAGELTISKTVDGGSWVGNVNQPFVFRVDYTPTGSSETITFYEVIHGGGSRTVVDLPRGTYTVTEIADWSTGFSPVGGTVVGGLEITYSNTKIASSFTNKRDVENYFHAIDTKTNKFKAN